MTDHLTENARLRAALEFYANPDAWNQPPVRTREGLVSVEYENEASKMQRDRGKIASAALATPAPDAVQEAARVPEIAALIEAAKDLYETAIATKARVTGGIGGQTIECSMRSTMHSVSLFHLDVLNDALRAIAESEASHE